MPYWVCVKCGERECTISNNPPRLFSNNSCPAGFDHSWVKQSD